VRPSLAEGQAPRPVLAQGHSWKDAAPIAAGQQALRPLELPRPAPGDKTQARPLSVLLRVQQAAGGARVLVSSESAPAEAGPCQAVELAVEMFADEKGACPELTAVDPLSAADLTAEPPRPDAKPFRATRLSFAAKNRPRVELARSGPAQWELHKGERSLLLIQRLRPDPREEGRPGTFLVYCGDEWDGGPPEFGPLRLNKRQTPVWDFLEGALRVYAGGADPYAFEELAVMAEIASPQNEERGGEPKIARLPCFFWEGSGAAGAEGEFRFRFAPPMRGTYAVRIAVVAQGRVTRGEATAFSAGPASSRGFVRARDGERVLRTDDGRVFLPVGLNLAWPRRPGRADDFRRWFIRLAGNGGNCARVWLSSWGMPLEAERAGVFDQEVAAALDEVFVAAQARDIGLILAAENAHDVAELFAKHPYCRDRGGPLPAPVEFFGDAAAVKLFKRRLTYLAARYGAFRSLLAWELFNELDEAWPVAKTDPQNLHAIPVEADRSRAARRTILGWTSQMAQHLEAMDAHAHPLTVSVALAPDEPWTELEKLQGLSFLQYHGYVPEAADARDERMLDEAALLAGWAQAARGVGRAHRPFWLGEFGYRAPADPELRRGGAQAVTWCRNNRDAEGLLLHNSLLAGLASGQAGVPLSWWWDRYVERHDLWKLFRGAAQFAEALATLATREGPASLRMLSNAGEQDVVVRVLGQAGNTGLCAWVQDRRSTWSAALERGEVIGTIDKLDLRLPGLQPGRYVARWMDTWKGEEVRRDDWNVPGPPSQGSGKALLMQAPAFRRDVALVVEPATNDEGKR
jgi:hypothetical protein